MKRRSIILLLGLLNFVFSAVKIPEQLEDFMEIEPISDEYFQNNLYIGWKGIQFPDSDWRTIYEKSFKQNEIFVNQRMKEGRVATNFLYDPLQSAYKLPENPNMLVKLLLHPEKGLVYLSHHLRSDQSLLRFKPVFAQKKRYRATLDYFFCREYLEHSCLQNTRKFKNNILKAIDNNQELLARFRELATRSEYIYLLYYNDFNISFIMRSSTSMTQIFQLNLADALLNIIEGDTNDGLDKLLLARRWIDLHYQDKSNPSTLHLVVNINLTQYLDQTMDALLSSNYLDEYLNDVRLEKILAPYPKSIGTKVNDSVILNMLQDFKTIDYPFIKYYVADKVNTSLSEEDEYIALLYLRDHEVKLSPKLLELLQDFKQKANEENWENLQQLQLLKEVVFHEVINENDVILYSLLDRLSSNESLKPSQSAITEWYRNFFQRIQFSAREALTYLNTKYPSRELFEDYYKLLKILVEKNNTESSIIFTRELLNELVEQTIQPKNMAIIQTILIQVEFEMYWLRLYEQQNYHQIVHLKYLIKKNGVEDKDIAEYLDSLGELARNTITGEAYTYDSKTKLLTTPLPTSSQHLPSSVRQIRRDNHLVKFFQVHIP